MLVMLKTKHVFVFFPAWRADLHDGLGSFLDPGCDGRERLHPVPQGTEPRVLVCQVGFAGQEGRTAHLPVEISPRHLVETREKAANLSWSSQESGTTHIPSKVWEINMN